MTARSPARRGTSLVEVLIASGLLLVILGLALQFLSSANRYQKRTAAAFEANASTLAAVTALSREFAHSEPNATASTKSIVFVGGNLGAAGAWEWNRIVCYYVDDVKGVSCLIRGVEPLPAPQASPPPLTGKDTSFFKTSSTVERRPIARNIDDLVVSPTGSQRTVVVASKLTELNQLYSTKITFDIPLR